MNICYVQWYDAKSVDEWSEIENLHNELALIDSCGFLLADRDGCIVLALNHDKKEDLASCCMIIPKPFIKKIKTVRMDLNEKS